MASRLRMIFCLSRSGLWWMGCCRPRFICDKSPTIVLRSVSAISILVFALCPSRMRSAKIRPA